VKRALFIYAFNCSVVLTFISGVAAQSVKQGVPRDSITGRVLAEGGEPIPNATVWAVKVGGREVEVRNVSAVTDGEGRYQLDNLSPGSYRLMVRAPGYVLANDTRNAAPHHPGETVNLDLARGGVITGTVTDSTGEPVVALHVSAILVREPGGKPLRRAATSASRLTDDRGVYRLYGLLPGSYLVVVRSRGNYNVARAVNSVPVYYPSATIDTATEVSVGTGDEVTGIDIRYRVEQGHAVSGTVTGLPPIGPQSNGVSIYLTHAGSGAMEASSFISTRGTDHGFAFYGVPDGEYDLSAEEAARDRGTVASEPRRVSVKGADVTELQVALSPLASLAGQIKIEKIVDAADRAECRGDRSYTAEDVVLLAHRDERPTSKDKSPLARKTVFESAPDSKGEFEIRGLRAGLYRPEALLANAAWYLKSIGTPTARPGQPADPAKGGIALKAGERIAGITVVISEGAAEFHGRVKAAEAGTALPERLRVHLIPADREHFNNGLRFREAMVQSDSVFTLNNIAPGRYWIVAEQVPDQELTEKAQRPVAWDAEGRARLLREAEALNARLELEPCRRVKDFELRYPQTRAGAAPKRKI
jgi:Carboxypeptidase regulatory-like domain